MRYFRVLFFVLGILACVSSCSAQRSPSAKNHAVTGQSASSLKPLVILDAGHGGTDEGARVFSFKEKKVALLTTLLTKKHLEALGYRVALTRNRDIYLSLPRRVAIANKARGSIFVSIHFNSSSRREAEGIEVFYYNREESMRSRASQRLASSILYGIIDQTDANSRGIKKGNFHVIRETEMPAVLVEGGFVTNQSERNRLKDRDYLDRLAGGIAAGVDRYLKH